MTTILLRASLFIVTLLFGCGTQSSDSTTINYNGTAVNEIKIASLIDTPRSFVKNYGTYHTNPFFAFVGEKISVNPLPQKNGSRDECFKAKYAIIQKVYGNFPQDTIEFIAYDHYGTPSFSMFKNVILYVSADSGTYYHHKYMYNDVYKTKDGRWAGAYDVQDYEHEGNRKTTIKPVKIDLENPIFYPLTMVTEQGDTLKRNLPKRYYEQIGDSALAIYGNYVEDLFMLKRDGYLTARRIFSNGKLTQ